MKITDIPLALTAIADATAARSRHASGSSQLAAVVLSVLGLHQHRFWRRRPDTGPGVGWLVTEDLAVAEVAECRTCGEIDADLFWCKHLREMFAALCSVEPAPAEAEAMWPDLTEAIHTARRVYEAPVATAVTQSLTNASYSDKSRIALANCVLASSPAGRSR